MGTKRHAWNDRRTGALCGLTFTEAPLMKLTGEGVSSRVTCQRCIDAKRVRHAARHPDDVEAKGTRSRAR